MAWAEPLLYFFKTFRSFRGIFGNGTLEPEGDQRRPGGLKNYILAPNFYYVLWGGGWGWYGLPCVWGVGTCFDEHHMSHAHEARIHDLVFLHFATLSSVMHPYFLVGQRLAHDNLALDGR